MSETKKKGDKDVAAGVTHDTEIPSVENAMESDTKHIEQIRDIIFGRQMSDYEMRFEKLENRINTKINELRSYTDETLKAIKKDFQDDHAKLSERLESEKNERGQDNNALSKALDALSDQQKQGSQQLSDQLTQMSAQFSDELHIQQKEASQNLENAFKELDDAKLARGTLSQMLKEVADRISDVKN